MTATYPAALTSPGPGTGLAEQPGTGLAEQPTIRTPRPRAYLMCRPEHFTVRYAINPWMASGETVDTARAIRQWQGLLDAYTSLGHAVQFIDGHPDLPDMVFAANGATVIGGTVLGARFRYPERAAEAGAYLDWFRGHGYADVRAPGVVNEGEGDILCTGTALLAGYGFRSEPAAAGAVAAALGLPRHSA